MDTLTSFHDGNPDYYLCKDDYNGCYYLFWLDSTPSPHYNGVWMYRRESMSLSHVSEFDPTNTRF